MMVVGVNTPWLAIQIFGLFTEFCGFFMEGLLDFRHKIVFGSYIEHVTSNIQKLAYNNWNHVAFSLYQYIALQLHRKLLAGRDTRRSCIKYAPEVLALDAFRSVYVCTILLVILCVYACTCLHTYAICRYLWPQM